MTLFTSVAIEYKKSGNMVWDVMMAANGALAGERRADAQAGASSACLLGPRDAVPAGPRPALLAVALRRCGSPVPPV
jgi:hypothetical protein